MENMDHELRNTQVRLSPAMVRACKFHSKKVPNYTGTCRGESLNRFVVWAVIEGLKRHGLDLPKQLSEFYKSTS